MSTTESTRMERASKIDNDDINFVVGTEFEVESQSDEDKTYTVNLADGDVSCTCPDHVYRGTTCKHIGKVADSVGAITLPDSQ